MTGPPLIRVLAVSHGPFPVAAALNHKIDPAGPILRATLDIEWHDPDPGAAIGRLEQALVGLSSSFERHECRGPRAYHVFLGDGAGPGPAPGPAATSGAAPPAGREGEPFDGPLALAHVLEHVVIDFLFTVADVDRCSGVTGARRDAPTRYDLMIECADYALGRLCLGLAVLVITSAFLDRPPGEMDLDPLEVARLVRATPGVPLTPPDIARAFGWTEGRGRRALAIMRQLGYLDEQSYAMNLSGVPEYRVVVC